MYEPSDTIRYFVCKSKIIKQDGVRFNVITVMGVCDTKREALEMLTSIPKAKRIGVMKGTRGQFYPRGIVHPNTYSNGEVKC